MSGQIYGFNQVFDANGNPIPGAKLLTRVPGTTTPKATYTDATLTVPLSNPVIADSGGRFPQIFADEGQVFDLVLTTATDVTIDSFYNVTALGASGNSILIDFGVDGRFGVIGEGGMPSIEFGDPVGDNVGGDGRIGGWAGTQGDTLEVDFATTTFTGVANVTGLITRGALGNAVPIILARGSASAAATQIIALPNSHTAFRLEIRNFVSSIATGVGLTAVLSFDGGGTYKTGATDYQSQGVWSAGTLAAANAAAMSLSIGNTSGVNGGMDITSELITGPSRETRILSQFNCFNSANNTLSATGTAGSTTNNKSYGTATNIRIAPSAASTMTFDYVLIGLP